MNIGDDMSLTLNIENLQDDYKLTSSSKALTKEQLINQIIAKVNPTEADTEKKVKPFPLEDVVNKVGETVQAMIIRYGSIRMAVVENTQKLEEALFREQVAKLIPEDVAFGNKLWKQRKTFEAQNKENGGKS